MFVINHVLSKFPDWKGDNYVCQWSHEGQFFKDDDDDDEFNSSLLILLKLFLVHYMPPVITFLSPTVSSANSEKDLKIATQVASNSRKKISYDLSNVVEV